jgi:hypothetical protein
LGVTFPMLVRAAEPEQARKARERVQIMEKKKKKSLTVKSDKNKIELSCQYSVMSHLYGHLPLKER